MLAPVIVMALCTAMIFPQPALAVGGTADPANPIQIENALPGTKSWRIHKPSLHHEIQGYALRQSVAPGQRIAFAVSTKADRFGADVYRMGWYGGAGARLVLSFPSMEGHVRAVPKPRKRTGLVVCRWPLSFSVVVPANWVSGIYLVKLTDSDGFESYIPFVIRESSVRSPLVMVDGVTTSEAYNWWGTKSLYIDTAYHDATQQFHHRAVMVSFHRPYAQNLGAGWFVSWEIHMVRWLERRGYDVSYIDDLDVSDDPGLLLHRKGIIIAGHDEYWNLAMRNAMDDAVASEVSLANFAANTGYWQIRLQRVGNDPDGIEICYKDFDRDPIHRSHPRLATVTWRSAQVHRPESELLGAMYEDYQGNYGPYPWVVKTPQSWVFSGIHATAGSKARGIVGHEEDALLPGYPHPKGVHVLTASPVKTSTGERRVSNATLYTASSGAIVFNAGTIDWSYGLDDVRQPWWTYPPARSRPSPLIERVTANVLNAFLR